MTDYHSVLRSNGSMFSDGSTMTTEVGVAAASRWALLSPSREWNWPVATTTDPDRHHRTVVPSLPEGAADQQHPPTKTAEAPASSFSVWCYCCCGWFLQVVPLALLLQAKWDTHDRGGSAHCCCRKSWSSGFTISIVFSSTAILFSTNIFREANPPKRKKN